MFDKIISSQKVQQFAFRFVFAAVLSLFLSVFSLSYYSVRYGLRIPLEGVAFQVLFVSISAALVLAVGLFVFEYFFGTATGQIGTATKRFHAIYALLFTLMIVVLVYFIGTPNDAPSTYFWDKLITRQQVYVMAAICLISLWLPVIFDTADSRIITVLSILSYVAFAISVSMSFSVQQFPSFLRTIGYGGGMIVDIEIENGEPHKHLGLMIRSNEYLILYDPSYGEFLEYKLDSVRKMTYDRDLRRSFILPCQSYLGQIFLEKYSYKSVRPENCSGYPKDGRMLFDPITEKTPSGSQ